jgi:hypothetical protein
MDIRVFSFATLAALLLPPVAALTPPVSAHASAPAANETFGAGTLSFEPNVGQAGERVRYVAQARGYTAYLTETEALLVLAGDAADARPQTVELRWGGAGRVEAEGELPGKVNYLVGDDPALWKTGAPTFARVRYAGVRSGVDLVFYGNERNLEYDFVVAPGADASALEIEIDGADSLQVDANGDLVMRVGTEEVRQPSPVAYQVGAGGAKRSVQAGYTLDGAGRVRFALASFDADRPLVVDPVLVYSTYSGGASSDAAEGIAVDPAGAVYVTGSTAGNWPTKLGSYDLTFNGGVDAFVTKIDAAGGSRVYSTYLGGASDDIAYDVAVDAAGCAYVTGGTESNNYPTTPGAYDTMFNGTIDVFVTKLDGAGATLVYSTFVGNDAEEWADSIAVGAGGTAYITGVATTAGYPVTAGSFDPTYNGNNDAFVTKLNAMGSALVYSSFLGGFNDDMGEGIAVDAAGNAYVGGTTRSNGFPTVAGSYDVNFNGNRDAFVTKVNPAGNAMVYSTFLGGNDRDFARDIAVATTGAIAGQAYLVGYSRSANYPVTVGALAGNFDAIVTVLDAAGAALVYSTFVGGAQRDMGIGIALDANGLAHVTGSTRSVGFPVTAGTIDATHNGGSDAFAATLDAAGALTFSTFLGAAGDDSGNSIAVGQAGDLFVTGQTLSAAFPVTAGVVQPAFGGVSDAFVAKIQP